MATITEQLALVGRRMFERKLTDFAGGNISARDGNSIVISPRYSGAIYHWQLTPEQFISGPIETDEILSNPLFSREGKAHLAVYRDFPDVKAIIHAHSFNIQPFAAACRPIPPVLEATDKFGVIPVIEQAPAHSADLAKCVVDGFRGQESRIRTQAAAVLMPRHGIMVAGKDLFATLDALERIDTNCWCIITQRLIGDV
jgi:L-fuculose-phosphate aldolase